MMKLDNRMVRFTAFCLALFFLSVNANASPENKVVDAELMQTLNNYFDGRRNADIALLRKAYDDKAGLETVNADGEIQRISFEAYLEVVKKAGPVKVETEVVDISVTQSVAVAQTRFDYGPVVYHDYLTLLKTKDGWKIINKAFLKL